MWTGIGATDMRETEIIVSEEAGVRTLHFGSSWVQGAMRVARPFKLELAYTREMMLPLLLRDWSDRVDMSPRVLVVGLGAGSIVKFLHHHFPHWRLTVVEINPAVHAAACQHFRLPATGENLRMVFADAADFVDGSRQHFDWIIVDGFDPNARMGRLCSATFFDDCARLLASDGMFCINLLSRRKEYAVCQRYIEEAFAGQGMMLRSADPGNALMLAGKPAIVQGGTESMSRVDSTDGDDPVSDVLRQALARAPALKAATGLDLSPALHAWLQAS